MKKYFLIFIYYAACSLPTGAQTIRQPVSARYIGLGAYSKNFSDGFSFTQNQAALANITSVAAGVYGERRFLLQEINLYSAVVALPTKSGNFGFQSDYFGNKNYNETQLGLAYGRSLGNKIAIGAKFNYYSIRIPGYGNAAAVSIEAGALFHLTEKFHAGIHVFNPNRSSLGKNSNEKLAAIYKGGIGYEASDKFFISAEIVKQETKDVHMNIGFQYSFLKQFFFRGGLVTEANSLYFGAGVRWQQLRIDVTSSYHQQLGISPGIMLLFYFNKPTD